VLKNSRLRRIDGTAGDGTPRGITGTESIESLPLPKKAADPVYWQNAVIMRSPFEPSDDGLLWQNPDSARQVDSTIPRA